MANICTGENDPVISSQTEGKAVIFLATITVAMLFFMCGTLLLVVLGSKRPPDPEDSENSKNIFFVREKQVAAADAITGPRILIVGGSSALFSIRPDALQTSTGTPVINLGIQAGLGLDYILYDATRVARTGDTVLLALEYQHYQSTGERDWSQADYTLRHDPAWLLTISFAQGIKLAGKLTMKEWAHLIARGIGNSPIDGSRYRNVIGPKGNVIVATAELATARRKLLDQYRQPAQFGDGRISRFAQQQILDFVDACRARGIDVVATFPTFMYFPEYETDHFSTLTNGITGLYVNRNVAVIGRPQDFLYPREFFFDTWYHLTYHYANIHSARLANALRSHPVYKASFAEGIDFRRRGLPWFVEHVSGLSSTESWGTWGIARSTIIGFRSLPYGSFEFHMEAKPFRRKMPGEAIHFRLGGEHREVLMDSSEFKTYTICFNHLAPARELVIDVPVLDRPADFDKSSQDFRTLGIAFRRIWFSSKATCSREFGPSSS